ncbi:hypothetical protein BHM03_00038352 [Ensete ventricosum]|nr:hypothetical protein BHM03_00038352 [Ensete ventricosum]
MITSTSRPTNWIIDSDASYHTSDLQNLSIHNDYRGNDDIIIDDGNTTLIFHTDSTTLNSHTIFVS